jgi:hypothetical protein
MLLRYLEKYSYVKKVVTVAGIMRTRFIEKPLYNPRMPSVVYIVVSIPIRLPLGL